MSSELDKAVERLTQTANSYPKIVSGLSVDWTVAADLRLVLAALAAYKKALVNIAAFDDTGAEERLRARGSYSSFDEPGSVQIARSALAATEGGK